jgi:hypothetical protein
MSSSNNKSNPSGGENRRMRHDGYSPVAGGHLSHGYSPVEERGYKPPMSGGKPSTPPPPPTSATNVSKPSNSGK